jgi:hypothetical protein
MKLLTKDIIIWLVVRPAIVTNSVPSIVLPDHNVSVSSVTESNLVIVGTWEGPLGVIKLTCVVDQSVWAGARRTVSGVMGSTSGFSGSNTVSAGTFVEHASAVGKGVSTIARCALLGGASEGNVRHSVVAVTLEAALGGAGSRDTATVSVGWAS